MDLDNLDDIEFDRFKDKVEQLAGSLEQIELHPKMSIITKEELERELDNDLSIADKHLNKAIDLILELQSNVRDLTDRVEALESERM